MLDVAKNADIEAYLESILDVGSGDGQSAVTRATKPGRKKKKRQGKLSELHEAPKLEQIVPSEIPISQTSHRREIEDGSVSICTLSEVGWGDGDDLDFPRRPDWRQMGLDSAETLHAAEESHFASWLKNIDATEGVVSTYERNLEYWRELWRVTERGDVYILLADARHPLLHLHRGFLSYLSPFKMHPHQEGTCDRGVGEEMCRPVLIGLSKSDLVCPSLLEAWQRYLVTELSIEVICISCKDEGQSRCDLIQKILDLCPFHQREAESGDGTALDSRSLYLRNLLFDHLEHSSKTVEELVGLDVEGIVQFRDLKNQRRKKLSKKAKARLEKGHSFGSHTTSGSSLCNRTTTSGRWIGRRIRSRLQVTLFTLLPHLSLDKCHDCSASEEDEDKSVTIDRPIVISVIGEPNVGKSSVINALLGIKKVAVSAHPGRTKHLQTHFLAPHLLLCDCPGLVFPKRHVPFPMQVRASCYTCHIIVQ